MKTKFSSASPRPSILLTPKAKPAIPVRSFRLSRPNSIRVSRKPVFPPKDLSLLSDLNSPVTSVNLISRLDHEHHSQSHSPSIQTEGNNLSFLKIVSIIPSQGYGTSTSCEENNLLHFSNAQKSQTDSLEQRSSLSLNRFF